MEGSWRNSAGLGSVLRSPEMVARSFSTASRALFLLAAEYRALAYRSLSPVNWNWSLDQRCGRG